MHSQIFVNLPVRDLKRPAHFFTDLGDTFNPTFTDGRRLQPPQQA